MTREREHETRAFRIELANQGHASALAALFERADNHCHCEWWHFDGDKNAWLDRCAHRPFENRDAMRKRLESDSGFEGLIALGDSGSVIGWMKLTASERVKKVYEQRVYRKLPCFGGDRANVLTIGCFLVDEAERGRGVASALLEAGIEHAASSGARAIEAFPRSGSGLRDEEVWTGPRALLERFGFEAIAGLDAYPVLRLTLAP